MPESRPRTSLPEPQYVMVGSGHRLATYTWGDADAEVVLLVHGFGSSTLDNWVNTGWVRDLEDAGFRVLALDLRGHGLSDKPLDPRDYSIPEFVNDVGVVLDTYLVDDARYVGYSLGARVGWNAARRFSHQILGAVLGGIPDDDPLTRVNVEQARAYAESGIFIDDAVTRQYVTLVERVPGNDTKALIALVEGMQLAGDAPDGVSAPTQPVLFATGTDDAIIDGSRALAAATPRGEFIGIPGRHHFTAPGSADFRAAAIAFLTGV